MRQETHAVPVIDAEKPRMLVYDDWGPLDSAHLFVCLPGLLETRESFTPFAAVAGQHARVVMLDFCGRGDSDWLAHESDYGMRTYLTDLSTLLARVTATGALTPVPHPRHHRAGGGAWPGWAMLRSRRDAAAPANLDPAMYRAPRLHLVGTSMGGLLAMVAASFPGTGVESVTLNDVGPQLPWTGMLALMLGMSAAHVKGLDPAALAAKLRIDPKLLRAVRQPGHLDIDHGTTLTGVDFSAWIARISAPILVLHGGESELLTAAGVETMRTLKPSAVIHEVPASGHPVPYDAGTCEAILRFAGVRADATPAGV